MYRADTQQTCKHWNHESSSSNKETTQAKDNKTKCKSNYNYQISECTILVI